MALGQVQIRDESWDTEKYPDLWDSCAICSISKKDNGKDLAVDHCHSTGKIRGLLCNKCNPAIGFLQDSPEIAKNALEYIKKHMT